MKNLTLSLLTPLLLLFSPLTHAHWRGFNLAAQRPEGGCKNQSDWEADFRAIKSLPGNFDSARLYAASDCDTLVHAVPASFVTGVKILAGVWSQNADHYNVEKAALLAAVKQYGPHWLVAVSVGSEDLYRKETTGDFLAGQIYDVRGMLASVEAQAIWVGHVDTWTTWVLPENAAVSFHFFFWISPTSFLPFRLTHENKTQVIKASDFIGTDGYPYFQNAEITTAEAVFWKSVNDVRDVVAQTKPGTQIWITETGHPVGGDNFGPSVPSIPNAAGYWKEVACAAIGNEQLDLFWYTLQDYTSKPDFSVVDKDHKPLFDLSC